jgi:cell shape-determining protein MreC
MSRLRFQHVFVGLMALSALSAFAIPRPYTNRFYPQLAMLFAPAARPAGAIGGFIFHRLGGDRPDDPRDVGALRLENQELKATVQMLSEQLEELAQRNAEREKLGSVRELCTPIEVVGADSGTRESLSLRGSTLEGIAEGMYVLYSGGVVGQIERAGIAGAQVRLITDQDFRVRGNFGEFRRRADNQIEFAKLNAPAGLVEGAGQGTMVVRSLTMEQVRAGHVKPNDWVILAEPDWPLNLQGQPLGKVTKISPRPDAPLFAQISIEPQSNLSTLREVMVVTKER